MTDQPQGTRDPALSLHPDHGPIASEPDVVDQLERAQRALESQGMTVGAIDKAVFEIGRLRRMLAEADACVKAAIWSDSAGTLRRRSEKSMRACADLAHVREALDRYAQREVEKVYG